MNRLWLYTLLSFASITISLQSEPYKGRAFQQEITIPPDSVQKKTVAINVKIDPLTDEQQQNGLNIEEIYSKIRDVLNNQGIILNETATQPILVLRIRTIQSGLDYATFFQLSLQEESMLVRNRSTFNATTWTQASLLSCRSEEFRREVLETVGVMVESFSKDFIKAIQG